METKSEKFTRISTQRLPKILHAIGLMGNLTGPAYESTQEQRATIVREMCDKINTLSEVFGEHVRVYTPHLESEPTLSTARQTSTAPNLQNIPVRIEEGRQLREAFVEDKLTPSKEAPIGIRTPIDVMPFNEAVHLIKTGPLIDAAINAIDDGDPQEARKLLSEVMCS